MAAIDVVFGMFTRVFGSRNERLVKRYRLRAEQVDAFEAELRGDFDARFGPRAEEVRARGLEEAEAQTELQRVRVELSADLRERTDALRQRIAGGAPAEEVLPEAFAVIREAARRARNHRHFGCQLIGGQVLYDRCVAEMKTGEGKTIVCYLPSFLNILSGKKVHIVTVNDYLVKRDAEFAQPIFELLGLTVGYIQAQVDSGGRQGLRRAAYASNITYGTNSEFGFDYLRDNMKERLVDQVQGRLDYVIIDEVDSILIDEARTPLIISGPAEDDPQRYRWADDIARSLVRKQTGLNNETASRIRPWYDNPPEEFEKNPKALGALPRFRIDPYMLTEDEADAIGHKQLFVVQRERKSVHLTHAGVQMAQDEAGIGSFYVGANMDRPHLIENALRGHIVYERDKEYVVQNREIIIVDEFTGRLMYGRQWSDGLHQAIEAKEGVPIKEETQTMATITIQNYFKLYGRLAGMTGTAMTESDEFMKIYRLEVVAIPTNRPVNRADHNDRIYRNEANKDEAIVEEIHQIHQRGRPGDPFLLADLLKALRDIETKRGAEVDYIDAALQAFDSAQEGDRKVINQMLEAYDRAMGELAIGRPILVGTTSVEKSEQLAKLLQTTYGIEHEVLNAKQHQREAEIVAKAGQTYASARNPKQRVGNVTIATNMAGRGTDIKLEHLIVNKTCRGDLGPGEGTPHQQARRGWQEPGVVGTKCCVYCPDYDAATNCAHCWKPKLDPRFPELGRRVCAKNVICGLHIVGTERHEARRIDNQLRGRAGRQGDPGSSRFFLSLEDDLLKLFMPDWMLKMMERLGFTEGVSLEDKRLNSGIQRAQKKVEEKNFSTRKHLLEWDEPMDFQRKRFYGERQRVLEGRDLRDLIYGMIAESTAVAARNYFDPQYNAKQIAEWCRKNLDVVIDARKLQGEAEDFDDISTTIRNTARDESRERISTTLGEYIDRDLSPAEWDLGGLLSWAQRSFKLSLSQNQLRKMSPEEIEEALLAAAEEHAQSADLEPVRHLLNPQLGRMALIDWARSRYGIEIALEDIAEKQAEAVIEVLRGRLRDLYHRREIEYPVEWVLQLAFRREATDSAYAAEMVTRWVRARFGLEWPVERVQGRNIADLARELIALNESFIDGDRLEQEVDRALAQQSGAALREWAAARFGGAYAPPAGETNGDGVPTRDDLLTAGRRLLRRELTELERYVLLNIFDQAWKDHLREMDHLKHAIMQRPLGGDQTHPQSQYAIEGAEFYDEMWLRIRERVTDTIFKVRLVGGDGTDEAGGGVPAGPKPGGGLTTHHADATGAGFAAAAAADQEAAMRAQGEAAKPKTIRREEPKVQRNDPCPCGSGKKYKNCHGRR